MVNVQDLLSEWCTQVEDSHTSFGCVRVDWSFLKWKPFIDDYYFVVSVPDTECMVVFYFRAPTTSHNNYHQLLSRWTRASKSKVPHTSVVACSSSVGDFVDVSCKSALFQLSF